MALQSSWQPTQPKKRRKIYDRPGQAEEKRRRKARVSQLTIAAHAHVGFPVATPFKPNNAVGGCTQRGARRGKPPQALAAAPDAASRDRAAAELGCLRRQLAEAASHRRCIFFVCLKDHRDSRLPPCSHM